MNRRKFLKLTAGAIGGLFAGKARATEAAAEFSTVGYDRALSPAEVTKLPFSIYTFDSYMGALTDADAAPVYRVYEDETSTAMLTGTMAKSDDANMPGFYRTLFACTPANGFKAGRTYVVCIAATVNAITHSVADVFSL